ncbi:cancer/testis antigen 1-like [Dasypus novemcinctus]|uniref:cancer/testis antigen 1-like n=1 Tax=Dasypus novemcinctus TaxID=9361 RepID=UPI00265E3824|nr:cancer/testis antigen 1-like [Dasypus novemcinctus]
MEAGEGAGGVEGGEEGQGGPGRPGGSGSPSAGPPCPSCAGGERAAAEGAPQAEGTLQVSGSDGAAGAGPEQLLEFTLTVHFLSFLEAEVARWSLLAAPFGGPNQRELRVDGSDLIVHLPADDPGTVQSSITSFLNDLAEAVRIIENIVTPICNNLLPGNWG